MGQELKIENLVIQIDDFSECIMRKTMKQQLTPPLSNRSTSPDLKRSPMERTVLGLGGGGSDHGEERSILLRKSDINHEGIPDLLMSFLEVIPPIPLKSSQV